MQIPALLSFSPSVPSDNDPYTFDFTSWLATVAGDTIASASLVITNQDGSPQTDVTSSFQSLDPTNKLYTFWLTGGVPGSIYVASVSVATHLGRQDTMSANLVVAQFRS